MSSKKKVKNSSVTNSYLGISYLKKNGKVLSNKITVLSTALVYCQIRRDLIVMKISICLTLLV